MPFRLIADAGAQSTIPGALTAGAGSVVVASSANFTSPQSFGNGQASLTILDAGNPAWNPAAPLATPYEYAYYSANTVGTNTLSGLTRGVAGTTPHAFSAGAIIAQGLLAEDIMASVPWKFDDQSPTSGSVVTIPASGTIPSSYLGVAWRGIRLYWKVRTTSGNLSGDSVSLRINGDTGTNYRGEFLKVDVGVISGTEVSGATSQLLAFAPGAGALGLYSSGWVDIPSAFDTNNKTFTAQSTSADNQLRLWSISGIWFGTAPITNLQVIISAGAYAAGSVAWTELLP